MAVPGMGHKSYIRIGVESTWGTSVATGQKLEVISYNVPPSIGVIQDSSLYAAASRRSMYQGGLLYRGTFVVRVNYLGMLDLFRASCGTYASSQADAGPPIMRDHKFTEGTVLGSLTIEAGLGDIPSGKVFKFSGCKIVNLAVRGQAGQGNDAMLTAEFTVLSKDAVSNQTPTTVGLVTVSTSTTTSGSITVTRSTGSYTTDNIVRGMSVTGAGIPAGTVVTNVASSTSLSISQKATASAGPISLTYQWDYPLVAPVLFHQASTVDDGINASGVKLRSFEFTLEQPHTEDRFYFGSVNIDEPLRADFYTARFRLTHEFADQSLFDAARAFTSGSPQIILRGTQVVATGTGYREFEIRANQAFMTEFTNPVESYGIILGTATWEAVYDATDASAYAIRVRNEEGVLP